MTTKLKDTEYYAGVFPRGTKVQIPKGTPLWGTFPGYRKVAGRTYTVEIVDSTAVGYEEFGEPYVTWAGSGGYWHHANLNDVEVVK